MTQLLQQIKDESRLNHEPPEGVQGKAPSFPAVHFDDKTEVSVNRPVQDNLFESDIVLNLHQARQILAEVRGGEYGLWVCRFRLTEAIRMR